MDTVRFYLNDETSRETSVTIGRQQFNLEHDADGNYIILRGNFLLMKVPVELSGKIDKITFTHSRIDAPPMIEAGVYVHKSATAVVETESQKSMWHIRMLEAKHLNDAQELYRLVREGNAKPTRLGVEQTALQPAVTVINASNDRESPLAHMLTQAMPEVVVNELGCDAVLPYGCCKEGFMEHMSTDMVIVMMVNENSDLGRFILSFPWYASWAKRNGQRLIVLVETCGEVFAGSLFGQRDDKAMAASFNLTMSVYFDVEFDHVTFLTDVNEVASMVNDIVAPEIAVVA